MSHLWFTLTTKALFYIITMAVLFLTIVMIPNIKPIDYQPRGWTEQIVYPTPTLYIEE